MAKQREFTKDRARKNWLKSNSEKLLIWDG